MLKQLVLAAVATGLMTGPALADKVYRLKFGHFLPVQSLTHSNLFVPMAEKIKEETDGQVVIQIFPGGSLGRNPRAQLQLLMDGVTDISFIVQSYTPGEFPDNSLMELPLVMESTREASLVHQRLYERGLLRGYDKVHVLGLGTTSAYNTHMNFDYASLDDLKGKKIRVATGIQSEIIEALGGTPVGGIPVTQTAESLSRGVIDGTLLGWESMNTFRVTPTVTHHVNVPQGFTPLMVGMNKKKYDSLPANLQAVIDKYSGDWIAERMAKNYNIVGDQARDTAAASGRNTTVELTAAERQRWEERLTPIIDDWKTKHPNGPALFAAMEEELAKVRASQ